MDFSKTENIIFVSVLGALILFFMASTIAVIAKGKRKATAWDIVLRVIASIVFAASLVLVVTLIFTQLKGDYRIDITTSEPTFYWGTFSYALPVPALFISLGTLLGTSLVTGVTGISFVALISDCLIANKKKRNKYSVVLGEIDGKENGEADEAEKTETEESVVKPEANDAYINETPETDETTAEKQSETEQDAEQTGRPDAADEPEPEQEETPWYAEDGGFDIDEPVQAEEDQRDDTAWYADANADTAFEDTFETEQEDATEYQSDAEQTEQDTDEPQAYDADETEQNTDEPQAYDAEQTEQNTDEPQAYDADETEQDTDEPQAYDADETEQATDEPQAQEREELANERAEEYVEPILSRKRAEKIEEREPVTHGSTDGENEPETSDYIDDNVEPDRDIYIPKMRTVERGEKTKSGNGTAARPKRTAESRPAAKAKSSGATKRASAKTAQTANGTDGKRVGDKTNLPVNRRYVIIDRHSAVNIFSNYLKDRDKQDKEKLESSISKVIIK